MKPKMAASRSNQQQQHSLDQQLGKDHQQSLVGWSNEVLIAGKRYSIIDQHLARHFKNNGAGLLSPPPFLCSQMITPFSHALCQSGKRVVLLANCRIRIPLF